MTKVCSVLVCIICVVLDSMLMLWFNFYFPLFYTCYHTLPYTKTKAINKN